MAERDQPGGLDAAFGVVEIVDEDADIVERAALAKGLVGSSRAVVRLEREVEAVVASMDRAATERRCPFQRSFQPNRSCINFALRLGSRTVRLTNPADRLAAEGRDRAWCCAMTLYLPPLPRDKPGQRPRSVGRLMEW